jgi:DNA-binding Lrp family transcriptional regulator
VRKIRELDSTDRAIIEQLAANGRLSNIELANRVSLTPAPCLRRVKRLEDDGVISGYHASINPEAAGRGFEVTVSVEVVVNDQVSLEKFEAEIESFEEVVEMRRVFGAPDYLLRVLVEDANAYERFQTTRLLRVPGISRTISHQTMKLIKYVP